MTPPGSADQEGRAGWRGRWADLTGSLALRMLAILTVALLPIGLIAVQQTREFRDESLRRAELSILALTEQWASVERETFERAFGVATALSAVIAVSGPQEACSETLGRLARRLPQIAVLAHVPQDGIVRCSSAEGVHDISESEAFLRASEQRRPIIVRRPAGAISGEPVVVLQLPIYDDSGYAGYVAISLRPSEMRAPAVDPDLVPPKHLLVVNAQGEPLVAQSAGLRADPDTVAALIATDGDLERNARGPARAALVRGPDGVESVMAVVPVLPGIAYAVAYWTPTEVWGTARRGAALAVAFPVLMWLASLIVGYYAVDRLMLRNIRDLRRRMRQFATDRLVEPGRRRPGIARELRDMEDGFFDMADRVVRDEALLEDQVRERGILLKEVHHRVKNNLQLISSILSMQVRRIDDAEQRQLLTRLQDRILGLAAVHRTLYQSEDMSRVAAGTLLREVVGQQISARGGGGIGIEFAVDEVALVPDQAVPLALLAAEAVVGAIDQAAAAGGDRPRIRLALAEEGAGECRFRFCVAAGEAGQGSAMPGGDGLSWTLIRAFAAQLGGQADISEAEGEACLEVRFAVRGPGFEPKDY